MSMKSNASEVIINKISYASDRPTAIIHVDGVWIVLRMLNCKIISNTVPYM